MEILLALAGYVALLLWGLRMVRTAVDRAYGGELKRSLGRATRNRFTAAALGAGVTALLQSSTATALMVATFAGQGLIGTGAALAVVLGADLGTTLVAQVLLFGTGPIAPAVILAGTVLALATKRLRPRQVGRAVLGIGLILLALAQLSGTATPLAETALWQSLLATAQAQPALAVLVAALMTWLAHSSLAVVLLTASFAAGGAVATTTALALVLGANLGAVLPQLSATAAMTAAARRPPLGNLVFRAGAVALALAALPWLAEWGARLPVTPERLVVHAHLGLNLVLVAGAIGLTGPVARLCHKLLPDPALPDDPGQPRYLDEAVIDQPGRALPLAAREVLRVGDLVEEMMLATRAALVENDLERCRNVRQRDEAIDRLCEAIKLYASRARAAAASEADHQRLAQILNFNRNLENAADILETTVMDSAEKKIRERLAFSDEGWDEIAQLLDRVLANLRLALAVFVEADPRAARQLIAEKDQIRALESDASDRHLDRLAQNRADSIATSSLHLDLLRDMKRINAHLAAIGALILESRGEMAPTRLRPDEAGATASNHPGSAPGENDAAPTAQGPAAR